jgi:hypothetical protein
MSRIPDTVKCTVLNECMITGCAGAGAAGVPQLWAAVGGGDTHGAASPAQDQVCGRSQALRARSLRPPRCLQVCISLLLLCLENGFFNSQNQRG